MPLCIEAALIRKEIKYELPAHLAVPYSALLRLWGRRWRRELLVAASTEGLVLDHAHFLGDVTSIKPCSAACSTEQAAVSASVRFCLSKAHI